MEDPMTDRGTPDGYFTERLRRRAQQYRREIAIGKKNRRNVMIVTVLKIEPADRLSMIFGVTDDGRRVAFHLPSADAERMQAILDRGDVVQAELPDAPSPDMQITGETSLDSFTRGNVH